MTDFVEPLIGTLFHILVANDGQLDGEGRSLAILTIDADLALVQIDHLLDIGQSETEALDVVDIARVDAVELLEDLLEVLFLDTLARVANGETLSGSSGLAYLTALSRRLKMTFWKCISSTYIAESTASMPV